MLCDNLEGWDGSGGAGREGQGSRGRVYVYILMLDSSCCRAETNTTL